MAREALIERNTKETQIRLQLNIDGTGSSDIDTGIGFFDHMLDGFARHGFFDLECKVKGDLQVDGHHTVEDVGIVVEMNTMRLLEHKKVYLTLTRKSDGKELMRIDLIPYLLLTKMEGHNIPAQEYLDRQSEYAIVFFYNPELLNFLSTKIVINGWTIWLKGEDL